MINYNECKTQIGLAFLSVYLWIIKEKLQRLAASEEVHYVPDIKSLITTHVSKEIQSSILVSLEKVEFVFKLL